MKDDAWIVQQFLNERGARELSGHGATLGAFERIRDRLAAAERGQKEALAQMCQTARELGEAQGKLAGSELPGVIDGWRERALDAERERDEARASEVEAITDQAMHEIRIAHLTEALEKAREGLKPFAAYRDAEDERGALGDKDETIECASTPESHANPNQIVVTVGDFRAARATIAAINAALKGE
jgi:hypothetical protein